MTSKIKKISFSSLKGTENASQMILSMLDYIVDIYEHENFETISAADEAHKLIFSLKQPSLTGITIAQWLAAGGEEKKARDAAKDFVLMAKKRILEEAKAREAAKTEMS